MYTVEDLEQLGDEFELDRGVLVPVMPGGESHGFVCVEVCTRLREYTRGKRLGRVYGNDTGFILERAPDTLRGPDVAFVKQERLTGTPKGGFFTGAPDLAVDRRGPPGQLTAEAQARGIDEGAGREPFRIDVKNEEQRPLAEVARDEIVRFPGANGDVG